MGEVIKRRNHDKLSTEEIIENSPSKVPDAAKMNVLGKAVNPFRIFIVIILVIGAVQVYIGLSFFNLQSDHSESLQASTSAESSGVRQCVLPPETVSAIKRATTASCKHEIKELVCRIQDGQVYPNKLPRLCPVSRDLNLEGKRLGCFRDSVSKRILGGYMKQLKEENSPKNCINICLNSGFTYAGVEYGVECFCGAMAPSTPRIDDTDCSMTCPGDNNQTCGGFLALDLYHTGLTPRVHSTLGSLEPAHSTVKVVFLLTLNGRALRQVIRLIQRLDGPGSYFYIHVDARQDYLVRELGRAIGPGARNNVRFAEKRFTTIWGGASLLRMLLSCMGELLVMKDWDWDFVLNLSESDYPVKSREELFKFLASNRNSNFVKSHGRGTMQFITKQGLDKTFYQCENRMWRLGSRKLPLGIQMDGGSDWVCINREFADYVINSEDQLVSGLKTFFNLTLLPAESFFHTALQNSAYCSTYINNNLHLTNWKRKQGCKCQYKAVVDWCGCSPNDFLSDDWTRIESTRPKQLFFARKFEPVVHNEILNKIDEWANLPLQDPIIKDSYWQNVYHHEDSYPKPTKEITMLMNFLARDYIRVQPQLKAFKLEKVLEVTLYKHKESLQGFLFLVEMTDDREVVAKIEMKVDLVEDVPIRSNSSRMVSLAAGTEFDPKELLFRNFLQNFGPDSDVSARCEFGASEKKENFTVGWFDPLGRLLAVNIVKVNETSFVENVVPALNKPLLPGRWTLAASQDATLVHLRRFLILPSSDSIPTGRKVVPVQHGLSAQVVVTTEEKNRVEQELEEFANGDTDKWLRKHVLPFYKISDACRVTDSVPVLTSCKVTSWSSRIQDIQL